MFSQTETYKEDTSDNKELYTTIFKSYDSLISYLPKEHKLLLYYYQDKGNFLIRDDTIAAKKYYLKAFEFTDSSAYYKPFRYSLNSHLARVSLKTKNYKKGLQYLKYAEKNANEKDSLMNKYVLSIYRYRLYEGLHKTDSTLYYLKRAQQLWSEVSLERSIIATAEIKIQLDTLEKEKKNLALSEENSKKNNIIIIILTVVVLGSAISVLLLKNVNKKRLLAQQQKELEEQKNITLLREQEMITINAMVSGQEKERKRVAEDLHDNLGSVLATLKLHFENLKMNREQKKIDQQVLFDKTEHLIDEAYLKVRSMAHAKNAGVIATQGLLPAVQLMAEKISSAHLVAIEVIHFGLEKRLENSLEITLFRIIQELVTNIIKHASASQATVNISQYENTITILVEDNGKGMDITRISLTKGMGIHSIQKRIEYLEGTFNIDTTSGKGTTVIMNIPNR
ncbi:MAG: hypothetical protein GKR88_11740 [Flavobacteriaceae bacterium]|nr:MAG: hypothetical protein GKR88_11740 [Flavobacteriaceae bacterium]